MMENCNVTALKQLNMYLVYERKKLKDNKKEKKRNDYKNST